MVDLHSHILYGLDDGAESLQESRRMLTAAKNAGVSAIMATPHVRRPSFDRALADERRAELSPIADQLGIRLALGFEVHWNVLLALRESSYPAYCFEHSRRMLIEFSLSADDLPDGHDRVIYSLQRSGVEVVIAHPERYRFVQREIGVAERWRDMGCLLQLDAVCLRTAYEPQSKRTARKLYRADLYDFYASDAHCSRDYEQFGRALEWIEKHA